MQSVKKVPLRQCTGCGESKSKKEMIRVIKSEDNQIMIDPSGKKNGRGAYICPSAACLNQAYKRKGLERSLKTAIPEEIYVQLKKELDEIEAR